MIIDTHTRAWPSLDQLGPEIAGRFRADRAERWGHLDASDGAADRAMTCVDASFVVGFRADRLGASIPNEFIADFVRRDPRRRLGIAGIDPMARDAMGQLDRAVDLGLIGVSVSPACQGFHPAHSAAFRIYERCCELSMPLLVSHAMPLTKTAELEFARPCHWDEVARTLPELPIVIGQLGHPFVDEALTILRKHENVWADLSIISGRPWALYNALLSAAAQGVCERLLFASGYPNETPAKAIENIYSVNTFSQGTQLPSVPRSLLRAIVERDSLASLGIDAAIGDDADRPTSRRSELHAADA